MSSDSRYHLFGIDFGQNEGQRELIRLIHLDSDLMPVVFCKGSAGTGKTFAALAASLHLVRGPKRAENTKRFIMSANLWKWGIDSDT